MKSDNYILLCFIYLHDVIHSLSIQHVDFNWILGYFASISKQSSFEDESIITASKSRIISPAKGGER